MRYLGIILLFSVALSACRKAEVKYEQVVQNDSDHDLWMQIHSFGTDTIDSTHFSVVSYVQDSIFIPKKSSAVLFSRTGKSIDQFSICKAMQDSISTIAVDDASLILIKDPAQDTNYVFNDLGGNKKVKSCECRIILKNGSFQ